MTTEVQMTDAEDVKRFIYAGRATFTIRSKKTGDRYTFRVAGLNRDKEASIRFVKVLSGPNNEADYSYIGHVYADRPGAINPGRKGSPNSASFKALDWALAHINSGNMPEQLEFYHAGKCGKCNRKLTVPESIETGLGPVCAGRID